ncbi:MAG TPA: GAF domain-containing protein [Alphaproteobacteria bacterium]|nr:GAF domain-containing protein [Alphaproteobacteria bacterium]
MSVRTDLEVELQYRLRQQSLISDFGLYALRCGRLSALLDEASRIAASGLDTEFAKVLEYLPDEGIFLVRAGSGWRDGVVGRARIGADSASPAGYALKTGRPVISNHLTDESRFRTPQLLAEHGVKRAINVILEGVGGPFGVLEVDSPNQGKFTEHDIDFLQALANLMGVAMSRLFADEAVRAQLRQRASLAALGLRALGGTDIDRLLTEAARLAADGLGTELAKVMEFRPAENHLLVRAGVGWDKGVVGAGTVSADVGTPAGYALNLRRPVVASRLGEDARFRVPEILARHDVVSAINVNIPGRDHPFGVFEVDSRVERSFTEDDANFLQVAANVLGAAIERNRIEHELRDAIGQRDLLLQEFSHRVKNNLQVVSSLLAMEARRVGDTGVRHRFEAVSNRVQALSRLYDNLFQAGQVAEVEFGRYLNDLAADLGRFHGLAAGPIQLEVITRPLVLGIERAVPLALIANELITNALKHAFPEGRSGAIRAVLDVSADSADLTVADDGQGASAVPAEEGGLGRQLIAALANQLDATVSTSQNGGTTVTVTFRP